MKCFVYFNLHRKFWAEERAKARAKAAHGKALGASRRKASA